ncbi:hypothetical protein SAMN05445756_1238 [Kytococcus aerolatus]|uniref:DUF4190 domain-containing protein n=1 Tax=Kytococcus aerolatus TaxID=592308 RepID=A0A212TG52_9MICO|nr:DUF4190 domain-containing protein [Kytococcus aerolatus]SNC65047.1 hypothetical protein SAMN05445756_1238 [Kytococcus aerolatus]
MSTSSEWTPPQPPAWPQEEHPDGIAVLVLGALSLVLFPPLGIIAWWMGGRARRDILRQPGRYRNEGLVTVGWALGIVGTLLTVVMVAIFVPLFLLPFLLLVFGA